MRRPAEVRVHVRSSLLGEASTVTKPLPWRGQTAAQLVVEHRRPEWREETQIGVAVNGRKLQPDEAHLTLPADCDVVLAPEVGWEVVLSYAVYALIAAVVGAGVSYAMSRLIGTPKPPGVPQERGDETSPTYGWDGMQTGTGQGAVRPAVTGLIGVPGHIIDSDVFASSDQQTSSGEVERLLVVLLLSTDRCHAVGGVTGGDRGEADNLGGFRGEVAGGQIPAGIRFNGLELDASAPLPGARVWLRMGDLDQSPLPPPFRGAVTTLLVNEKLDDAQGTVIKLIESTQPIANVRAVISEPGGMYQQNPATGAITPYRVQLLMEWRHTTEKGFNAFLDAQGRPITAPQPGVPHEHDIGRQARIGNGVDTIEGFLPPNTSGPIEVRITRFTPRGSTNVVSNALWRQLVYAAPVHIGYAGRAIMGMELRPGEKASGSVQQFVIPLAGRRVTLWDPDLGWAPFECWDVPAAPWNWMKYPPGRNPAWALLQYLIDRGIDPVFIDLPAFRDWSIFCDEEPFGWTEPRFTCDMVRDTPRPKWEWVLRYCQAGRAIPVWNGHKISVAYQYRDEHSDAGASPRRTVPARVSKQLLSASHVKNPQIHYLPRAFRPTALQFQILNEEKTWRQDVITSEDSESTLNEPTSTRQEKWRPEPVQYYVSTRPSQCKREGVWMHRVNRLVRSDLRFQTGPWTIGVTKGDVFSFQHDILEPFDEKALGLTIRVGGTAVIEVTVDRELVLDPMKGYVLLIRDQDGVTLERDIVSVSGADVTLSAVVTCAPGAAAAFGVLDKVVKDYQVDEITLDKDMNRDVQALEWVPAVYDDVAPDFFGPEDVPEAQQPQSRATDPFAAPAMAEDISCVASAEERGKHVIAWSQAGSTAPARVFAKPVGATRWFFLGESTTGQLVVAGLGTWVDWEVAVITRSAGGTWQLPDAGAQATVTAAEFPPVSPPNISGLIARPHPQGWALAWEPVSFRGLACYEVRRGTNWLGGHVVYRGSDPQCIDTDVPFHPATYWVCAQATSGLYSLLPAIVGTAPTYAPPGRVQIAYRDELVDIPSGTLTNLVYDPSAPAPSLVLGGTGTLYRGTYETLELDTGFGADLDAWWSVATDFSWIELATLGEMQFAFNSGEARWWRGGGREPSPAKPGANWSPEFSFATLGGKQLGDLPKDLRMNGRAGDVGSHVHLLVESRFYAGGAWGAWRPHRNGVQRATKMQARVTIRRRRARYVPRLVNLTVGVLT